jgi:hypothetical protein
MIEAQDLTEHYADTLAMDDLSFTVHPVAGNRVLALLGSRPIHLGRSAEAHRHNRSAKYSKFYLNSRQSCQSHSG